MREKNQGISPLNSYNRIEQWQSVLFPLIDSGQDDVKTRQAYKFDIHRQITFFYFISIHGYF